MFERRAMLVSEFRADASSEAQFTLMLACAFAPGQVAAAMRSMWAIEERRIRAEQGA